ncbi:MAG: DUF3500 domain-containing protein [Bacteroidota bacterium]
MSYLFHLLLLCFIGQSQNTLTETIEANVHAAKEVLEVFPKEQVQSAFSDLDRYRWSNLPVFLHPRKGVNLEQMTAVQKKVTQKLLQAALSETGYLKANWILWLDERRKAEMKAEGSEVYEHYGQGKFWLSIFGTPAKDQDWAWRFEGHHLSINVTFKEGKIYVTPLFLGAHPTVVADGPFAGLEVMGKETRLGNELFGSLSKEQKTKAIIQSTAYDDILTRTAKERHIKEIRGLKVAEMTEWQQTHIKAIATTYFSNFKAAIVYSYLGKIDSAPLTFAWAGTGNYEDGIYYRIQSSDFIIEYDHRKKDIGHIHSVFYDIKEAFGGS